jgi:hypothetical protein
MNQWSKVIFILLIVSSNSALLVRAETPAPTSVQNISPETILNFIKDYLKEKAKYSGNVDFFDEKINKVRNLNLLQLEENLQNDGDVYFVRGKFRDVASGDIATVKMNVRTAGGKLEMGDIVIESIDQIVAANTPDPNHKYTDQEIKDVMMKYLKQKAQFTGTFDMFDEKTQKMRNLELGNIQEALRTFGTRSIGRVDAVDHASNENLELDVSVDNKDGVLSVKTVKIFSVNKVQR